VINEQQASVFIAPEGTRSRDDELGPFKMGPFHLAAAARVPITPVVLRGARSLQLTAPQALLRFTSKGVAARITTTAGGLRPAG
jgi:putative phosphoserine phosphatase / 1-acylglycerol-3-phosphate O-acyltransferase